MTRRTGPLPPADLAIRVGVEDRSDPLRSFDEIGRRNREIFLDFLPDDWSFKGKRVLDFGCGPGKVLRHFMEEAEEAEFYGCDIHAPSIQWLENHMSPPLKVFVNQEVPPLSLPDNHIDLVWAASVFTHIVDAWSAWLVELYRILADGGLFIASFLCEGLSEDLAGEPWIEDRVGMNVVNYGQDWELGGPTVFLSPWWIRAHWGRAFEILDIRDKGPRGSHGIVLARKRSLAIPPSREQLEEPEPNEPRELLALRHQARQLFRENGNLRTALETFQRASSASGDEASSH
jgi:SAM-dependent methyltransferase